MTKATQNSGAVQLQGTDQRPTYVIGHRNPDTDAICSAISYADFLRQTRFPGAEAACCGPPNARTEWVLKQAGLTPPRLLVDVGLRARDVGRKEVSTAAPNDSVFDTYHCMVATGHRSMPVVDDEGCIAGMLSLLDLLELLIPTRETEKTIRMVRTTIDNVAGSLGAEIVHGNESTALEADYFMMVGASSEPVVIERMKEHPADQLILITGDRAGVQLLAVEAGVRCLVITGGFKPSDAILAAARANRVAILSTKRDTATTTQLIRGSRRIAQAVSSDFLKFDPDTPFKSIQQAISATPNQFLFPVVAPETNQLVGVFSRSDLVTPPRPRLVLVDHNEFSQAVKGAREAEIVEVLDHHRLSGNLVTQEPVQFINAPVGSTCTLVARSFRIHGLTPSKPIILCMIAGIVSDTLQLTSPTTTDEDRETLRWLGEAAGVDIDHFALEFFRAGSVLRTSSPAEAVTSDRKEYGEHGHKISISQVEEVGLNHFWPVREALQAELKRLIETSPLDIACLLVTDITRHSSLLLVEGSPRFIEKIEYPRNDHGLYQLDGVVSRKKQLFPWLSSLLAFIPKPGGE